MPEVNFDNILSTQMDAIEAPKPTPQGRYRAKVEKYEYKVAGKPGEEKPTAEVYFKLLQPIETEDDNAAAALDFSTLRDQRKTFWLTGEALHYTREFIEQHCHVHGSGRGLGECFTDIPGKECGVTIIHTLSKKDGKTYANVQGTFAL